MQQLQEFSCDKERFCRANLSLCANWVKTCLSQSPDTTFGMQGLWPNQAGTHSVCGRKKSYTRKLGYYILDLLRCMTIEDVAQNLKLSWNTVKNIEKSYLKRHYSKPTMEGVKHIAIDEFAVLKGHVYMTVVMDLNTKRALYIGDGRKEDSLDKFWKRVKKAKINIEAVAIDMWPAYIGSVIRNAPNADIVFDHFHIVKKLNTKIDELRRQIYAMETDLNNRTLMKGTRWLLLKNQSKLSDNAKEKLQEALAVNESLYMAYYLKEELKLLWEQTDITKAEEFLDTWTNKANETGLTKLKEFANTLKTHRSGILNWYNHHISTGPLEGFNNKIKVLKRKAYGYRDFEFFKLKIHTLHLTRYELL